MAHRVSPEAEDDLVELWCYVATHGHVEAADRLVEAITSRFFLLAMHPEAGRRRDDDLRPGVRTFQVGECLIAYRVEAEHVLILRVIRGGRDTETLLGG